MPKKSNLLERLEEAAQETAPSLAVAVPEAPPLVSALVNGATETPVKAVRRGRRPPANPNESKHDKLIRLADARVTKACKAIQMIGNLAAYKPSEHEIELMMQALGESCASVANRLNGTRRESITFTLR